MTKDQIRDKRLRQKYGITLEEYNQRLVDSGGVCEICGKPPGKRSLHVDHDHAHKRVKIHYRKIGKVWVAYSKYRGLDLTSSDLRKAEASRAVRKLLKFFSVRGVLCFPCNRTLRSANNSSMVCRRAAEYLERFYHPLAIQPTPTSGENHENT